MAEAREELVDAWLEKAGADREAAELLEPDDDEHDHLRAIAAFHWQQAAEKCLKAFLVTEGIRSGKTHDVAKLIELAAEKDESFEDLEEYADSLDPFAVEIRYPGEMESLSHDEYEEVKEAGLAIVEFTKEKIEDLLEE